MKKCSQYIYHHFSMTYATFNSHSDWKNAKWSAMHWNTTTHRKKRYSITISLLYFLHNKKIKKEVSFLTSSIPAGLLGVLGTFLANCFVREVFVDLYSIPPMLMNLSECFFGVLRKKVDNECMNCWSSWELSNLGSSMCFTLSHVQYPNILKACDKHKKL